MKTKINKKALILLSLALVSGVLAAISAQKYITDHIHEIEESSRVKTVDRIVAAYDLPAGSVINADRVAVRKIPVEWVPSVALRQEEFSKIDGLFVTAEFKQGDPILMSQLQKPKDKPFSDRIGYGRRALTIPVDTINSVSGMLVPGDLIDLYVSFEYMNRKITAPLLQGVLVMATGSQSSPIDDDDTPGRSFSTVTLDISPEQAARLVSARQSGTITALLRNPDDKRATQKGVQGNLAKILGISKSPPKPRKKPVVVYGNEKIKGFSGSPAKSVSPPKEKPDMGIFDLPGQGDIVSDWMNTLPPQGVPDDIQIDGGSIPRHPEVTNTTGNHPVSIVSGGGIASDTYQESTAEEAEFEADGEIDD